MTAVLAFNGVSKRFRSNGSERTILNRVSVSVDEGEFLAITGPSGSGKSTFLNLCALLDEPSLGEIRFDGQSTGDLNEHQLSELRKRAVGMVFQQYCLLKHRTVLENVMFRYRYLAVKRSLAEQRAREALALVGLSHLENSPVRNLSGGEMQRIGVARAIALEPRILVADEPTGNLDSASAGVVMQCLADLNRHKGIAVLLVTHNEALLAYAGRHLVCANGSVRDA